MFENPLMLAGLGGAVVPLIIHLLGRARYRTVEWGAMMFLDPTMPRWRDGARLREYLLLAVRMAAVGLLAVALARPIGGAVGGRGGTSAALTQQGARLAVAIVVDCSASMAYQGVGPSRMDAAKSAALQVLATLRRGDRVLLIPAGGTSAEPSPPQLTGDLQAVAARIAELKPAAATADLAAAIDSATGVLGPQERVTRQLYVICDQQAESWRRIDDDFVAGWKHRRQRLERFVVIPVGGRETDNVMIEAVAPVNLPAVRGCAMQVDVRVRNFALEPRVGLPLTLRVAGGDSAAATVNLGPLETTTITLPVTFAQAGPSILSAEIKGGGPPLDDRRDIVVEVSAPLETLIVRGVATSSAAPDPLAAALAPFRSVGRDGPDVAAIEVAASSDWGERDLSRYRLIVLDDVPQVSDEQAAALEKFVYAGGGLLLAPGAASRIEEYNRVLYREENGLLPALLQPPVAAAAPLAIEASTIELTAPLLRFLPAGAAEAPSLPGEVERYFPLTGRTPAAHVLAALTSGDALLIDQPFGRGRVALWSCSLGRQWSSLPLTNLFLPLMQSTARYLAADSAAARNFNLGEEVVMTIAPAVDAARGVITRPDGRNDECDITSSSESGSEIRYARTDLPGVYTARVGPRGSERRVLFSVAPPHGESELTPLAVSDWEAMQGDLGFERIDPGLSVVATRLGDDRRSGEYWMVALAGVLGLLIIEMALTRRWSAGR